MKKIALASAVILTACTTPVTPLPIDGSKADGKVTLTYEYGLFEKPVADWEAANSQAVARCKAWGYSGAESFGAQQEECVNHDGNDCYRYRGTINYQCID